MDLYDQRRVYTKGRLLRAEMPDDPMVLFEHLYHKAAESSILEANAMTLSTANTKGEVSSRIVLLKRFGTDGFVFFTNYNSAKAKQIEASGMATLLFFWPDLECQIQIRGTVVSTSEEESDAYFNTRPVESRIGAVISHQSEVIEGDDFLDQAFETFRSTNNIAQIMRPDWGGYLIQPYYFEFWQGRPGRLHDRFRYQRLEQSWIIDRLSS